MSQKLYKDKHIKPSEVNEPMVAYATSAPSHPFFSLLSGVKQSKFSSDQDILQLTRDGLPKRILLSLAKKISLTIQELANIMHISERTLQRYDDNAIIKTEYAEKAIELARLYTRGEEVFGSMDKFKAWMKTPSHIFKGEAPVSLLDTSFGFNMIFKELGRIEHGIFA
jgi:putative toxin-antitoxin system antitoxin component (TIGR02293 family)